MPVIPAAKQRSHPAGHKGTAPSKKRLSPRFARCIGVVGFVCAAVALAWWMQFIEPERLIARDSLYHVGHAAVYAARGPFYTEFPWPTYSIIRQHAADIWYGFHLLIVPFASLRFAPEHQVNRVKWTGVFLTASLLVLVYLALRRGKIRWPWAWPFVMVVSCMFRYAQVRPQLLSTGLAAVLFASLVNGGAWAVFLLSTAICFLHLAFFWLVILVSLVVVGVKWHTEGMLEWKKLAAALGGIVAGWLLRPNPLGAAKILYVQIVQLWLQREQNTPLSFGRELSPVYQMYLLLTQGVYLAVWFVLAAVLLLVYMLIRERIPASWRTWLWSSLGLSVLFFVMMIWKYMRSLDHWTLFSTLFMAGLITCLATMKGGVRDALARLPKRRAAFVRGAFAVAACGLFAGMAVQSLGGQVGFRQAMARSMRPYRYRQVGDWLSRNTPEGAIVFHASWGIFPELFFWNTHNRYIGGMDPMFQYTYSSDLYWKADHIFNGTGVPETWGTPGAKRSPVSTYTSLRRDFRASYLFLEKTDPGTPRDVVTYVQAEPRFVCVYEDAEAAVLKLVDEQGGQ